MFLPRSQCGVWPEWLLILYFFVQIVIFYSYFKIPYDLRKLQVGRDKKSEGIGHSLINWLFILFIAFCGLGHLMDAISLWYANYYIMVTINLFTAIVSYITSLYLPKYVNLQLARPTQEELNREIEKRVEKEIESKFLTKINLRLNQQVNLLKGKLDTFENPIRDLDELIEGIRTLREREASAAH